ncbi:MAG TPA: ribbon-helix-helix protein, CopG family [Thermoplasmata archaeon]|nr:ribbon-helix-helix protein, CopG family [Thermoplasmata archaeon]
MTTGVVRLGVSLEPDLLDALDRWASDRNSTSRSDAIRFLIRKELSERALGDPRADAVGAVMVLYRHTSPNVLRRLTAAQHRWGEHIQASTHFHLRGDACLEVLVLKGKRSEVEEAAEDLRGVKGIIEGDYLVGTPTVAGGGTGHHHPHRASAVPGRSGRPAEPSGAPGSRRSRPARPRAPPRPP